MNDRLEEQLRRLSEKYEAMGQDMESYLEGLIHTEYLTYWSYIQLDTLLSLQQPRTSFEDETIFITYHQITELYFKLILHEMDQLTRGIIESAIIIDKINRLNRYIDQLNQSFVVMHEGMDREQFLKFRMALLPSSGFQSAQYRLIELHATSLDNLTGSAEQKNGKATYDQIYWKRGASELASGKKTLTLQQFEKKYDELFQQTAKRLSGKTLNDQLINNPLFNTKIIKEALKNLDYKLNIEWALAHYKAAAVHLLSDKKAIEATGGTNWQQYLPPRFQKIQFFPSLWTGKEKEEWGSAWVKKTHAELTASENR